DAFFGGQRRDSATGRYQLGARTYDPGKANFLTPDSYRTAPSSADLSVGTDPLTENRYNYVNGDPVNLLDPTGHNPCRSDDCDVVTNYENAVAQASGGSWASADRVQQYADRITRSRIVAVLGAIPAGPVPAPGPNPKPGAVPSWQSWEDQVDKI